MVSLFVHALLGVAVLAFTVRSNSAIFTRIQPGPQVSALELFYYLVGVASSRWAITSTITMCRST